MRADSKEIVRDVLGRMGDEAPDPLDYSELESTHVVPPLIRRRPPGALVALAAFATVIAIFAVAAIVDRPSSDGAISSSVGATVFLVPDVIPDGLDLVIAEVLDAGGASTDDLDEAAGTGLSYLPPGQTGWRGGDRAVLIMATDLIARTSELLQSDTLECFELVNGEMVAKNPVNCRAEISQSACSGLASIEAEKLNVSACRDNFIEGITNTLGDDDASVVSTESTIRGKPSFVVEVTFTADNGLTDQAVYVMTHEGAGVMSYVTVHQFDLATALRIAEGLRAVASDEFTIVVG